MPRMKPSYLGSSAGVMIGQSRLGAACLLLRNSSSRVSGILELEGGILLNRGVLFVYLFMHILTGRDRLDRLQIQHPI